MVSSLRGPTLERRQQVFSPQGERERMLMLKSLYSVEREESTFLIFSVFSSYLHYTICYGQKQHMTVILVLYGTHWW